VEPGSCANVVEPCECGAQPGCGWDSEAQACVEGGKTECAECPHTLLCHGGDTHDVCASALFKNPDVLEAINKAKVCMQSERDGMEYCLRHSSHKLKALIEAVEWNGDTIDCCGDNKFFSMVCEGPKEEATPTTPAPAETPEAPEPEEEAEEEEEPGTTTSTTTELDLMGEIERLAREYGLVTTTPAPGGDGDGSDDGSGDGSEDGAGADGADGADGAEGDGGAAGGAGADGDAAGGAAGGAGGGGGDGNLDQSAKNTADQVNALNDARAEEPEPIPPRKTPPEDKE